MSLDDFLNQVEPLLQSDKFEDVHQAIKTLIAAKSQFEVGEQERIDDLLSGILQVTRDPTWDRLEEDDGIPTLDVNTGKWTNADKLDASPK